MPFKLVWAHSHTTSYIDLSMHMYVPGSRGCGRPKKIRVNGSGLTLGHAAMVNLIHRKEKPGGSTMLETLATCCLP